MQARWTSGAQTNSGPIKVSLQGGTHHCTLIRPEYPNLSIDLDFIQQEQSARRALEEEKKQQEADEKFERELLRLKKKEMEENRKKNDAGK